jgi:hypothetical protein
MSAFGIFMILLLAVAVIGALLERKDSSYSKPLSEEAREEERAGRVKNSREMAKQSPRPIGANTPRERVLRLAANFPLFYRRRRAVVVSQHSALDVTRATKSNPCTLIASSCKR